MKNKKYAKKKSLFLRLFKKFSIYINPNRTLSRHCEFETDLDLSNISSVEEEVKFDKKGRQKSFKRIIRLRKGD